MDNQLIEQLFNSFESITLTIEGVECWSARELQKLLGYTQWRNFRNVIENAKIAAKNSNEKESHHFAEISKKVSIGSESERYIEDYALTRYACYLIAQNGDPSKSQIAFAMTYFAVQTRKQEIIQKRLSEIDRVKAREKLTETENILSGIIYQRGVDNRGFGNIRSKGDQALFGGYSTAMMKRKLSIPDGRPLADFLPTVTIKAKDLAAEMTNVNVVDKDLRGEQSITNEHIENNKAVRKALGQREIIPENLPAADDLQKVKRKLESENKKVLKGSKHLNDSTSKMKIQQDLTDEEIYELNREAEISEMEGKYDADINWLEENGYEEGGDGGECPSNNGGHNIKLWHNPKTNDTISACPICGYVDL